MANVLFIAYDYPPILSPEAIQVQRRALTLANNGHNIYVVTCHENAAFEFSDYTLISKHKNIKIIRTKKPFFEIGLNLFFKLFDLTDRKFWWKKFALNESKKIIRKFDIDIVYTHSTPLVDHLVGLKIKEHFPSLRWISHFSDPWTLNPYKKYKFNWQCRLNRYMEKKVYNQSDFITVTSNKTKKLFENNFLNLKSKIHVLPHTFDKSLFHTSKNNNEKIIITHTGNIYGLRTIKYLIEALVDLKDKINYEFRFYGKIKKEEMELVEKYDLSNVIKIFEQVPYLKSLKIISESDYLLLIDAPLENSPFFPSKLADYIGSSKPIIALTPFDSASVEILNDVNNNELMASSGSKEEIKNILQNLKRNTKILFNNTKSYNMNNYNLLKEIFEK